MGLVRRRGSQSDAHLAQTAQMGNHGSFLNAGTAHPGGLHEARPRTSRPRRRTLCTILFRAGGATLKSQKKTFPAKAQRREVRKIKKFPLRAWRLGGRKNS